MRFSKLDLGTTLNAAGRRRLVSSRIAFRLHYYRGTVARILTVNIQTGLSGLSELAARFIIINTQLLPRIG
jgi:hypothetical protein